MQARRVQTQSIKVKTHTSTAWADAGVQGEEALLRDSCCYLDRDTRRGPRTRVLTVITRRSAHCSLLCTHKPGSPLLLCLGHTPMPLAGPFNPCLIALNWPPKVHEPVPNISRSGPRNPSLTEATYERGRKCENALELRGKCAPAEHPGQAIARESTLAKGDGVMVALGCTQRTRGADA